MALYLNSSDENKKAAVVSNNDYFVQGLQYIQDPRTHLCFAVSRNMESSAILVPCENIPKELLHTADPTPK